MSDRYELPFVQAARDAGDRLAVVAREGRFTYDNLLDDSARVANTLLAGRSDLGEERIVLLIPPGYEFVAVQWGIWRAGGVAVPLALAHPAPELASLLKDVDPSLVIAHLAVETKALPAALVCGIPFKGVPDVLRGPVPAPSSLPVLEESRRAQIIYTSGTTGKPKGAIITHANIRAQVDSIARAWDIDPSHRILNALPFHHVHGIVNALACPLSCGARVEILPSFDAREVWERIASEQVDVLMGVPTMYVRMISVWEQAPDHQRLLLSASARRLRLTISGSAALPVRVLEAWKLITGQILLERYGLTETGMVLSNPLEGRRVPGHVGSAMPGVEVRVVRDDGSIAEEMQHGNVEVRGENVFEGYWRRPGETAAAFRDGWFLTGDRAVVVGGHHRILGRESVDIIKTGGEKVSALEVEEVLRNHPRIADCAVVGVPDLEWGECVCAAIVPRFPRTARPSRLREWTKRYLAAYKAPVYFLAVDALPRNSMGKVVKTEVRALFQRENPGSLGALS